MTERTRRRTVRTLAAAALAAGIALAASGCAFVQQQTGDAWAVTYEVHVDQPTGARLTDVQVEGAERRGDAPEVHELGDEQTTKIDGDGSQWEHGAIVLAEQRASVRVTPGPDATATCRILLDGDREIASATSSEPGATVACAEDTPAFD
jgi:hypothetical protein